MLVMEPAAKDLQADIVIKSNPSFMTTFKTKIWPMVAANCGGGGCHGSPAGAGRLKLYNLKSSDDAVFFTNFLILDSYESSRGRLIDRNRPAQSLLLQFGLPEDVASARHPVHQTPIYNNYQDLRYQAVDEWIRGLLNPHPVYELSYQVPGEKPRALPFQPSPVPTATRTAAPAAPGAPALSAPGKP